MATVIAERGGLGHEGRSSVVSRPGEHQSPVMFNLSTDVRTDTGADTGRVGL
jgi:hypothetical protein